MDLRKYREKAGFVRFYVMLLLACAVIFYAGFKFANVQKESIEAENKLLNKSLSNLSSLHTKLQSDFNMLEVELDISKLASERSLERKKEFIEREQTLKEQVSFYQRVLAPEKTQDGFVVERMEIVPTFSENNYAIKMILLQHQNIKAIIKGKLKVRLYGSKNGKPDNVDIVSVQDEPKSSLAFAFKYFQVLETSITLPNGFTPERFEISTEVYKYNRKRGDYNTTINWLDAFAELE